MNVRSAVHNLKTLVIGYGNTLRGDDGVGVWVADRLHEKRSAGMETLAVHQLTPELAMKILGADRVCFLDASRFPLDAPCLTSIDPDTPAQNPGHILNPQALMNLAKALAEDGRVPPAWLVRLPAQDLGFGCRLSPSALKGARRAVELVLEFHQGALER